MKLRASAFVLLLLPFLAGCQPLSDDGGTGAASPVSEAASAGVEPGTVDETASDASGQDSAAGSAGESGAVSGPRGTGEESGDGMEHGSTADGYPASTAEDDSTATAADLASPKPADPLTPAEMAEATSLALGSPDTERVVANAVDRDAVNSESLAGMRSLSGRPSYRVLYTQRAPDKSGLVRAAEVGIFRYDTNEQVLNYVDLESGKVSAQEVPVGYMLPLALDEITEATTVARSNPEVLAALQAAGLDVSGAQANALLTVGLEPGSPCATNRCLKLFFSSFEQPVPAFHVIVNLSSLSVVEVVGFDQITGGDDS